MRIIFLLILIGLSVPLCQARLNETFNQCVERYGAPLKDVPAGDESPYRTVEFLKNGIKIEIQFLNDKAGLIIFNKTDDTDFSKEEEKILLDANSEGSTWSSDATWQKVADEKWNLKRKDLAYGRTEFGILTLISKEMINDRLLRKATADQKHEQELKKQFDGF